MKRAKTLESKGDLVEARKNYKLAVTVNRSNKEATSGLKRVEKKQRSWSKIHYRKGLQLNKKGKYSRARHHFLIALRLWPEYPEAIKMLTSRKRLKIKKYIVHTIKPGETLSKVAIAYYGDYKKFSIIAQYNGLGDATKIAVGQKIKVPEIEGVNFSTGKKSIKTEKQENFDPIDWDWEVYALKEDEPGGLTEKAEGEKQLEKVAANDPSDEKSVLEPPGKRETAMASESPRVPKEVGGSTSQEEKEPLDQIALNRNRGLELYRKKRYLEAVDLFDEILKVSPQDEVASQYSHLSHFDHAIVLFEGKDYLAARDQFEESLRHKNDCQVCYTYIEKSEKLYKEMHYKNGIQLFGRELLVEAIKEWELVRAIDADYKRVGYSINKAKTILKNVEKLKKNQRE